MQRAHPVEHFGQGCLPGDLFQQGAVLGHQPLGMLDLGGLHPDHPDPGHGAAGVAARLVGEVEERLPRVRAGAQQDPHVPAGVGLTRAVDLVQQLEEALAGELGHQLGEGDPGAGPVLADGREERRVRRLHPVLRPREQREDRTRLPEQGPQVLLRLLPGDRRIHRLRPLA